jgi:hypothetical protein
LALLGVPALNIKFQRFNGSWMPSMGRIKEAGGFSTIDRNGRFNDRPANPSTGSANGWLAILKVILFQRSTAPLVVEAGALRNGADQADVSTSDRSVAVTAGAIVEHGVGVETRISTIDRNEQSQQGVTVEQAEVMIKFQRSTAKR